MAWNWILNKLPLLLFTCHYCVMYSASSLSNPCALLLLIHIFLLSFSFHHPPSFQSGSFVPDERGAPITLSVIRLQVGAPERYIKIFSLPRKNIYMGAFLKGETCKASLHEKEHILVISDHITIIHLCHMGLLKRIRTCDPAFQEVMRRKPPTRAHFRLSVPITHNIPRKAWILNIPAKNPKTSAARGYDLAATSFSRWKMPVYFEPPLSKDVENMKTVLRQRLQCNRKGSLCRRRRVLSIIERWRCAAPGSKTLLTWRYSIESAG